MQKQSIILVLAGIFIAAALFTPIPYRQRIDVVCIPCFDSPNYKCPKCPKAGDIIWQPSIAQLILGKLFPKQEEKTIQIDPTANWKTYTNERFSYSIKYPQNFRINSTTSGCIYISDGNINPSEKIEISIGKGGELVSCFPTGLGVVDKQEELGQFIFNVGDNAYKLRDVRLVVSSSDYVWGALVLDGLGWPTIKNKAGKEDFSIFYTLPYSKYANNIDVIRKILSTFQFLE